ncbi:MAG: DUF1223 domain-containing protein [Pseudomonadota bacterium]
MKRIIILSAAALSIFLVVLAVMRGPNTESLRGAALASSETLFAGTQVAQLLDGGALEQAERPVVVELYTSQGCYSCPPADDLLGELADIPNLVALSFHVDYWDYIGWKDEYALPGNSDRQRDYARALKHRFVYTPQMVIDGATHVVGSRRGQVLETIESIAEDQNESGVTVDISGGKVRVSGGQAPDGDATVWMAVYDREKTSDITRGENAGKKLAYHNVVREFRKLGSWDGDAAEFALSITDPESHDGCAIIIQHGETGRVIAAADMTL